MVHKKMGTRKLTPDSTWVYAYSRTGSNNLHELGANLVAKGGHQGKSTGGIHAATLSTRPIRAFIAMISCI